MLAPLSRSCLTSSRLRFAQAPGSRDRLLELPGQLPGVWKLPISPRPSQLSAGLCCVSGDVLLSLGPFDYEEGATLTVLVMLTSQEWRWRFLLRSILGD